MTQTSTSIQFDAQLIQGFSDSLLRPKYDNPLPTPDFHRELWRLACLPDKLVAIGAPRGHGKSTAMTHAYTLASICFRQRNFIIILSDTEGQASNFLGDIKAELIENEDLRALFGIDRLLKDNETDCIFQFTDGARCRILAKGAGQRLRGLKWLGKRPDMVICDDMESDQHVENKEVREKMRHWFLSAVLPCLSSNGIIRYVGTVLNLDALLERLLTDPTWVTARYKAHNKDYSEILWPELHTEESLKKIRQSYIVQGAPEKYSAEYLNDPIASEDRLFRDVDFIEMQPEDFNKSMVYYAAADFAISLKEKADSTVMLIGAMDSEGLLYIVDRVKGRMDSLQIIDEMINIQKRYNPEVFLVETEKIDKSIGPFLRKRMMEENTYINVHPETPTKDKIARAQSISARMKQGAVRFHKENDWYEDFYAELSTVTRSGVKGRHDDSLDAFAWLGLAIDKFWNAPTFAEIDQEEYEDEMFEYMDLGASEITGY